ncbi:hypothetical protein SAMN05421594_1809 [Chryseobacterium oleae]|uniref:Uncharacterized protein n=1 Tax=Chryseobacterium oleae TaxID=491207 RepID=A0A1I4XFJ9_CHROL|nr:hypothetical protein [Chryseobacterium oleae]SFN24674.1 hypothetical protein SAMN05421594_1809 [Chryseobacterium oleae]
MKTSNFNALVAKMETLKENEKGLLKGGIGVIGSSTSIQAPSTGDVNNVQCKCVIVKPTK